MITITISINGQLERTLSGISWQSGMNVQQAMESAYGHEQGYDFALQYFGPALGYEVTMIDNLSQQSGTDTFLFWQLSINGKISNKGIDKTILNDGDEIEWNYMRYEAAVHEPTRYKKLREVVLEKKLRR